MTDTASMASARRRDLLRNPGLLGLLARDVVSLTGTQMTWVALPWFVLTTTGSPTKMTLVIATEVGAIALFGLLGGSVATRIGARRMLLVSDGARAPLVALVPTLHLLGLLSLPLLLALVAVIAAFTAPVIGSKSALLPEIVGEDEGLLAEANALLQGANRSAMIAGPVLAGVLIGFVGATTVLYVDAATFVLAVLLVATLVPVRGRPVGGDEARGVTAGLRFLWREPLLRPWSLALVAGDVAWIALFATMPVLVLGRFGADPHVLGFLFGGFGFGALLGSAVAFRWIRRFDRLLVASVGEPLMVAPLWLLLLDVPAPVAVGAMALAGIANGIVNAPLHTLFMVRTPAALRPKVFTAVIVMTTAATPPALLGAGPALEHVGVDPTLAVILAVQSVAAVVFTVTGLRERTRVALGAAAPA